MEARGSIMNIYVTSNYYYTREPYSCSRLVQLSLPVKDVNLLLFRYLDTISRHNTCMVVG